MRDPIFFVVVLFVALGLATEDDYDEHRRAGNGDSVSNQRAPPPSGDVQQGADCCSHKSAHHKGTK